jgi:hypothetical protein
LAIDADIKAETTTAVAGGDDMQTGEVVKPGVAGGEEDEFVEGGDEDMDTLAPVIKPEPVSGVTGGEEDDMDIPAPVIKPEPVGGDDMTVDEPPVPAGGDDIPDSLPIVAPMAVDQPFEIETPAPPPDLQIEAPEPIPEAQVTPSVTHEHHVHNEHNVYNTTNTVAGDPTVAPLAAQFGSMIQHIQGILTAPAAAPIQAPVAAAAAPNPNTQNVVYHQQQGIMAAAQTQGRMIDGIVPKLQQLVEQLPSMTAEARKAAAEAVSQDNELQRAVAAGTMSWKDILAENSAEPSISYANLKTLVAKLTREGSSAASSYKDTYTQFVSDKTRPRMRQVGTNLQIWQGPKWLDS